MDIIEFIEEELINKRSLTNEIEDEFRLNSIIEIQRNEIIKLIDKYLEQKFNDNENIISSYKYFAINYLSDYFKKIKNINRKKKIVNELMKLELPSGVEVEIKA